MQSPIGIGIGGASLRKLHDREALVLYEGRTPVPEQRIRGAPRETAG
jgi:hypothetical protein